MMLQKNWTPKSNSVIKQHLVQRKNDLRPPPKRIFRALSEFWVKSMIQATQDTFISKIHVYKNKKSKKKNHEKWI